MATVKNKWNDGNLSLISFSYSPDGFTGDWNSVLACGTTTTYHAK
jgi:hypothetical protein